MAITDVNGYPLKWEAQIDISEAERNAKTLKKILEELNVEPASKAIKDSISESKEYAKSLSAVSDESKRQKEAQLANMEAMRESRLETQKQREELSKLKVEQLASSVIAQQHKTNADALKVSQQQLRNEYTQGRIDLNAYTLEQKKLADAQKLQINAQKESDRVAREAAQEIRRREADTRRQEAQAERRRKQLEKESSEYYKLNTALGVLRTQSKNVLAEMFRLEQQGLKNSKAYQDLEKRSVGLINQTNILDKGIKKIDASLGLHQRNVGNYASALDVISPQYARINSQLSMMGVNLSEIAGQKNGMQALGTSLVAMGKNILAFLASPIGLTIIALTSFYALITGNKKTVTEFNSGLLNVSKTTGIAGADLDKLGESVVGLSRSLQTVGTGKLLEYATVAGQLGVKGTENILNFTEALAKLETASNITGEKGGSEIARLLTLTDGGVQNVKDFGDEIVNLGNNFAATEAEILDNATAISQNTGLYRIARQDVLAYATATKALGLESEIVGSTMNRTLAEFEKTIRTGKGLDQTLKVIGGSADELKRRFKTDAAGVFNDYIAGLNKIHVSGGSVNAALTQTGVIAVRDQRVIASLASSGFDTLTRAMDTVKDSAGAMDREFRTKAASLENQTARIGIAWDNLVLTIEDGTGVFGKATVAIADYFAGVLEGVAYLVESSSWKDFWDRVSGGYTVGLANELDLRKTLVEMAGINKEFSDLANHTDSMEKSFKSLGAVEFNRELERAKTNWENMSKAATDYQAAVESKRIKETDLTNPFTKASVEAGIIDDTGTIEKYLKEEKLSEKHYDEMLRMQEKFGFQKKEQEVKQNDESGNELTEAELKALAREKAAKIKAQRALQAEIDKMVDASKRKQMTRDQEELQAIEDKYEVQKQKIKEFREDPKGNFAIDASGLDAAKQREIDEAKAKQQVEIDKQTYSEKKVLFDEFEKYRSQVGVEEANKRFSADLQGFGSYVAYLKSLMPSDADQSVYANKLRDLLDKEIPKAEKDEVKRQEERYTKALLAAQTHDDRLKAIESEYQESIKALGENADQERLAVLEKARNDQISAEVSANLKMQTKWEETFESFSLMSKKSVDNYLKDLQKRVDAELAAGKITAREHKRLTNEIATANNNNSTSFSRLSKAYKEYRDLLKRGEQDNDKLVASAKKVGDAMAGAADDVNQVIGALSQSFQQLGIGDENLDKMVNDIMGVVDGVGEIGEGIATGNPVDIITGSIKLLTSAISLFSTKDKKLQKQIDGYQKQLEALGKAYKQLERDISNSVGESYYSDSAKAVENLRAQQIATQKILDAERKKKKSDKGKITELENQLSDLDFQIKDTEQAINAMLLQSDFKQFSQSLADALVSAFEQGEDAIDALDKTFNDFIKKAVSNSAMLKILQPIVDSMMDEAAKYAKSNDNSLIGFDFEPFRERLKKGSLQFSEYINEAFKGLGLDDDAGKKSGIKGAFERTVTESTANEWIGLGRATYDLQKRAFEVVSKSDLTLNHQLISMNNMLKVLNYIRDNTKATADNTERISEMADNINTIARNTGSGQSDRDLGL